MYKININVVRNSFQPVCIQVDIKLIQFEMCLNHTYLVIYVYIKLWRDELNNILRVVKYEYEYEYDKCFKF